MAAEAEIELGNLAKGQEYINLVRARAANPVSWVPGAPANYQTKPYALPFADQTMARKAVRSKEDWNWAWKDIAFLI
jgi:hypothetical protein